MVTCKASLHPSDLRNLIREAYLSTKPSRADIFSWMPRQQIGQDKGPACSGTHLRWRQ